MKPTRSLAALTALAVGPALGLSVASPALAASLRVTPSSGLPASGATVSVSGSGFDSAGNNGVGIYVVFGPKRANFHQDANAFATAKWVHKGGASGGAGQALLSDSGSFSVTLQVKAQYTDGNGVEVDCLKTPCYILTMAAHGVADRSQDTFTRVTFKGAAADAGTGPKQAEPSATLSSRPSSSPAAATGTKTPGATTTAPSRAPAGDDPSATPVAAEEETVAKTVSSSDAAPSWPFWTALAAVAALGLAGRAFTRRRRARR